MSKVQITFDQACELYTLRTDKLWSWYELAQRYGITEAEARSVYADAKAGKLDFDELEAAPFGDGGEFSIHGSSDDFTPVGVEEQHDDATEDQEEKDMHHKDDFTADIFSHIEDRIHDYANGDEWDSYDLIHELSMYENMTGAWIIGRYQASEYIRNHWEEASDTYEYFHNDMCMDLNPFEDTEGFTFYMLAYGVETLCSYSDILQDGCVVLTEETASRIVEELNQVDDLTCCRW